MKGNLFTRWINWALNTVGKQKKGTITGGCDHQRNMRAGGISLYLDSWRSGRSNYYRELTLYRETTRITLFLTCSLLETDLFWIIVGCFPLFVSFKLNAHLPHLIAYLFPWKIMSMKFLLRTESLFGVIYFCCCCC